MDLIPKLQGHNMVRLESIIGADAVIRAGNDGLNDGLSVGIDSSANRGLSFADEMLKAVDGISASQNFAGDLAQRAITEPGTIEAHDVTIAQAQAEMELNIARTILTRLTQAWQNIINVR